MILYKNTIQMDYFKYRCQQEEQSSEEYDGDVVDDGHPMES